MSPTDRTQYREAVAQIAAKAKAKLPEQVNGRIEKAVALVLSGDVLWTSDGGAEVGSGTDALSTHRVRGTSCSCDDSQYGRAPQGFCKHVLAVMIYTRVHQEMAARSTPEETETEVLLPEPMEPWSDNDPEGEAVESPPAPEPPAEGVPSLDPHYVTFLHGKPFVRYMGLLAMAHAKGLVSLKATFISVTADMALAEAEAVFADGTTYVESADSTPANVPAHIKPHYPRMALTRSKARCLRDALNISMTALEEVEGE